MKFFNNGKSPQNDVWNQVSVNTLELALPRKFVRFFRRDRVTTGSFTLYGKYLWQEDRE